jgi:hypothetical protein
LDPQSETVTFVLFALVIGAVIFGGTTLAYFLGKRRSDPPSSPPARPLDAWSKAAVTRDDLEGSRDQAA